MERIGHDLDAVLDATPHRRRTDVAIVPFGDGHSGFTYVVDTTGGRLVLRLSPSGVRIAGPADVGRQGRIMSALHAEGLPVPRVLACSSAPTIDGRAFALMEHVEGTDCETAAAEHGEETICAATIDTLKGLARVPPARTGIGDEEPVDLPAELDRWSWLLEKAPDEARAPAGALASRLRECLPDPDTPTLVHGDFHYANLLFRDGAVVAIVDWEIAEIGQPLVDLASLTVTALRGRYRPDPNPSGDLGVPAARVAGLYGGGPERAAWYTALGCLKYAGIIAYNLHLHRSGRREDPVYEKLVRTMHGLLDDGVVALDGGLAELAPFLERVGA